MERYISGMGILLRSCPLSVSKENSFSKTASWQAAFVFVGFHLKNDLRIVPG